MDSNINLIHNYFENQVVNTPNKIAVQFNDKSITYTELNKKSNALAHYLRSKSIGVEDKVVVNVDRSINLIISLLAVLKSGAAYVPINSKYPKNRINHIYDDVKPKLTITSKKSELKTSLVIDDFDFDKHPWDNLEVINSEKNLAYIIYTSGSTGIPKGVMIEHRNTCQFLKWAKDYYMMNEKDVLVAFAPVIFDLSVFEIFTTLISGAKLIIAEKPYDIYKEDILNEVSFISTVPSAFRSLTAFQKFFEEKFNLPKLSKFNFAGEVVDIELINKVYENLNPDIIYNCYGPTETTTYATVYPFLRNSFDKVFLGHPITPTQIFILDKNKNEMPCCEIGEIYIGGACVSRGYVNFEEETNKRFLTIPGIEGKVYKTGDLGSKNELGVISYHGRIDNQVKIKGYRIELEEVEIALRSLNFVQQAAVISIEKDGNLILIAFLVFNINKDFDILEVRNHLKDNIPSYMIPTSIFKIEKLPITMTGKLDRIKLLQDYKKLINHIQ